MSSTSDVGSPGRAPDALLAALHDLRQPVQAAQLLADVMASQQDPEARRRTAALLEGSLEAVDTMIGELAALARLETQELVPAPAPVDLGRLLAAIGEEARSLARVHVEFDGGLSVALAQGDSTLLVKLLRGLTLTAVRAARERQDGRPVVPVRLGRGAGRWSAVVTVAGPEAVVHQATMFVEVPTLARGDGLPAAVPGLGLIARLAPHAGARLETRPAEGGGLEITLAMPAAGDGTGSRRTTAPP